MKLKPRYILLPLLILLSCSLIKIQDENKEDYKTEFSQKCLKINNEFKTHNEHVIIYNDKTKKYLSLPEFCKILETVSKYDLNKNLKYKVDKVDSEKIKKITWKAISKKDKIISIEKSIFKTKIEQKYNEKKYINEFTIIDYSIKRNIEPKKIYLRVIQDEFEKLTIGNVNYLGAFESRILGIDEAQEEFDKLLNKK